MILRSVEFPIHNLMTLREMRETFPIGSTVSGSIHNQFSGKVVGYQKNVSDEWVLQLDIINKSIMHPFWVKKIGSLELV